MFSGRSADSIFGRQHTRSRINKLYLLAYLHTMALSFFISLFVTYTDIANRQTTNIFFGFLGSHSSDAREKKEKKKIAPSGKKSGNGPLLFPNKRKLIFSKTANEHLSVVRVAIGEDVMVVAAEITSLGSFRSGDQERGS